MNRAILSGLAALLLAASPGPPPTPPSASSGAACGLPGDPGALVGQGATGTTQAAAAVLTSANEEFTTVAAGAGVVLPPTLPVCGAVTVFNDSGAALLIWPPVIPAGGTVEGGAANAPATCPAGQICRYQRLTTTAWH